MGQENLRRGVVGGIARNQREATQLSQGQLDVAVQEKLLDAKNGGPGKIVAAFDPQRVKVGATIQDRRQVAVHRNQVIARAAKGHIAGSGENVIIAVAAVHQVRADAAIKAIVAVQPGQRVVAFVAAQAVSAGGSRHIVIAGPHIAIDRGKVARVEGQNIGFRRTGNVERAGQAGCQVHGSRATLGQGQLGRCGGGVITGNQGK